MRRILIALAVVATLGVGASTALAQPGYGPHGGRGHYSSYHRGHPGHSYHRGHPGRYAPRPYYGPVYRGPVYGVPVYRPPVYYGPAFYPGPHTGFNYFSPGFSISVGR